MLKYRGIAAAALVAAVLLLAAQVVLARPQPGSRSKAFLPQAGSAPSLEEYLFVQRLKTPSQVVISGFYDWRTVSQYRSHAGLHLGYDVAMPYGSIVVAGWPDRVTRVVPWTATQYGITVLSDNGYETTYGHLAPLVQVGAVLSPGDVVGSTIIDHVDIKMIGPDGLYYDFGHSQPGVAWMPGMAPAPMPRLTRAELLRLYLTATYSLEETRAQADAALKSERKARQALKAEREAVLAARKSLPQIEKFFTDGLIPRKELDEARDRVANGGQRVSKLERQWRALADDYESQTRRIDMGKNKLDLVKSELSGMGVKDAQIKKAMDEYVRKGVAQAAKLRALQEKNKKIRLEEANRHARAVAEAKDQYEKLQRLYLDGAVSRDERDRARAELERLTGRKMAPEENPRGE